MNVIIKMARINRTMLKAAIFIATTVFNVIGFLQTSALDNTLDDLYRDYKDTEEEPKSPSGRPIHECSCIETEIDAAVLRTQEALRDRDRTLNGLAEDIFSMAKGDDPRWMEIESEAKALTGASLAKFVSRFIKFIPK